MSKKLRVGILGATGMVGQRFVQLLENHPQFQITALAASDRSQGKTFAEACTWRLAGAMPESVKTLAVQAPEPTLDCDLVFSSLPGDIARKTEGDFAAAGYPVISNSSAFRMDQDVPLLVPEINPEHLALIDAQKKSSNGQHGFIVTNPNCSTIMLALALAPLDQKFGIESVIATTMQALSGAGYPGVASLAISDNVLPFIESEEEKIEEETLKILGKLSGEMIDDAQMKVSAQCHRVNVSDGHLAAVRVKLKSPSEINDVKQAFSSFSALPQQLKLHSAPEQVIIVREEKDRPQPRLDRDAGKGMSITIGRLQPDNVLDYRFVVLSHNTIRGAAGAAILNAELMLARGNLK